MSTLAVSFDPFLPWALIWALATVSLAALLFAARRGLKGWPYRALGMLIVLAGLANPALRQEDRDPLANVALLVVDESSSQTLARRAADVAAAEAALRSGLEALGTTEIRTIRVADSGDAEAQGTRLATALARALRQEPADRLAGVAIISDGVIHDAPLLPEVGAPVHFISTGRASDWDRRIVVTNVPAFAIVGETVQMTLRIEDQGAAPAGAGAATDILVGVDGGAARTFRVPVGQDLEVPLTLEHAGINVIEFAVPADPSELTPRNNFTAVSVNGVRDRLRVLLVSGEPHPGERTWRNLLKSDGAVDLVHFTILRPPTKQDGVPVTELSLIAFPTRELFLEKVDEFDLIIFDRYSRRGILPGAYYENIARYVRDGGAVLVSAGSEFAGAESIFRTALADVLPAAPTARVVEAAFRPAISDLGARHPVTAELAPPEGVDEWGRWNRLVEVVADRGQMVMTGAGDKPLLLLDRVGKGRVALLASDQAWLWHRGYDGGGPQVELLRRLAHWLMKEPELEEEALRAETDAGGLVIARRSLEEGPFRVTVTAPDGTSRDVMLAQAGPGRFAARIEGQGDGLYRLTSGELHAIGAIGPPAPREFEETVARDDLLAPLVAASGGASLRAEDGAPDVGRVRAGRVAAGRGWIGFVDRDAYAVRDISLIPLLPVLIALVLAAALAVTGWLHEGR